MGYFNKKKYRAEYFLPVTEELPSFAESLCRYVPYALAGKKELIVLCIGTDKIAGDCLGPLVGARLMEKHFPFPVYGTLQSPVHAVNLLSVLSLLKKQYRDPFFLVTDAAAGPADKIGYVSLADSPLCPGKGLRRQLPPVGNISITGIVCDASSANEMSLARTSLCMVNQLADFICQAIMGIQNMRDSS